MRSLPPGAGGLPIAGSLDAIADALAAGTDVVLVAEPGAGKTTVVPLLVASEPWCHGKVVVVEPRRVAARAAAERLAASLGEAPGETVGWRMRGSTRVGARTRIEVVTDGVLTRMLQRDPSLDGVSCVVLDEFHERSLDVDLALALCLDAKRALRDDLRLLVMSATIDVDRVARLLGDSAVVTAPGRTYPVDTVWLGPASPVLRAEDVAGATARALRERTGDVLVFLPGAREIRAVERALAGLANGGTAVLPLHGSLPAGAQDRALAPARAGTRKVVLATNIAETSLTIDGIGAVVDSGWARRAVFDAARSMSSLVTVRVSQASAEQRRGRAGRLGPGVCYRLWAEHEHRLLAEHHPPEITQADLVPLAAELARWGDPTGATLAWLDPPPPHALEAARALLQRLDVLEPSGRITAHGRAVADLPVHPRLAHALLCARERDASFASLACDVAALLGDRDLADGDTGRSADLARRVDLLRRRADRSNPAAERVRQEAQRLRTLLGVDRTARAVDLDAHPDAPGAVVASAFPDRVARRRDDGGRYLLANGVGASLRAHDDLATSEWLAVADLEVRTDGGDAQIRLAAPVDRRDIEQSIGVEDVVVRAWDRRTRDVRIARERRVGAIVLASSPVDGRDAAHDALVDGVRAEGLALLPRLAEATPWRARVAFCRAHLGDEWPATDDPALVDRLDEWLRPALVATDARRAAHLARIDVAAALAALLPWPLRARLDELAPTHVTTPNGRRRAVDYQGTDPLVSVRLQDAFGWTDTPRLAGGRAPLVVALLSPADRPVQVTRDLAGFWTGSYAQVRAELRGRYPKHRWPEDPTAAAPAPR